MKFFKDRGYAPYEAVALMGTHALLDEQTCYRCGALLCCFLIFRSARGRHCLLGCCRSSIGGAVLPPR
jgi:hypothetical protein